MYPADTIPIPNPASIVPRPSWFECITRWIPIVGWHIANELERKRLEPFITSVKEELRGRSPAVADLWKNGAEQQFALFLCEQIQMELDWPNAHFIPADSFGALFIDDDGVGIDIAEAVEQYLGLATGAISSSFLDKMNHMTLGQAVEHLLSLRIVR